MKMGLDVCRFEGEVDEELICPICTGVLEEPVQSPPCEHAFCSRCIQEWLLRQASCPVDRLPVSPAQLKPAPRILRNLLSRLMVRCENAPHGCPVIIKLELLQGHVEECEHNPKRPLPCEQGCGLVVPKDQLSGHNCVKELRSLVHSQQANAHDLTSQIQDLRSQIHEHTRELQILKDFMRAMRVSNPSVRAIADEMERDEVVRWSTTLARARVTRWGGMISTPDALLQTMIKRSLSECGCPTHILEDLMENAHERRWPPGLSSLETRQMNRRQYEGYVCRRIPGKQAVIVLQCDNPHVSTDLMVNPGLVMIFAHGVE